MPSIPQHEITVAEYTAEELEALDPPEIFLAIQTAAYAKCAAWEPGEKVQLTSSDGDMFNAHVEDVMPATRPYAECWIVLD